jgi:recombination directionality factor gp3-like protein
MGILGLTHDEKGTALEKLPVTMKVAIGEGPEPGSENGHPRKLDHFVFKRKTLRGQDVVWVPASDIAEAHGEKPTELGVIFLNDDPREVFRTEYALWAPSGCKCRGELVQITNGDGSRFEMQATRRTPKHPEGEAWPGNYRYIDGADKGRPVEPCGNGCPDLEWGDCRPSGDLYFILEKFPMFGAICRLHTSSYRSVRNLSNGLMQIRRMNGGRLTGIKAILKATPERISYSDRDGTRHTSVAYILSLEIGATNLRALVANMTEPVRLLGEGRAALDLSRGVQYFARETDAERAAEIAGEFYPDGRVPAEEPVEPAIGHSERDEQLARICELARRLGLNDAMTKMLIRQSSGDLAGLERKLLNELDDHPGRKLAGSGDNGHRSQRTEETSQTLPTTTSNLRDAVRTDKSTPGDGAFLF